MCSEKILYDGDRCLYVFRRADGQVYHSDDIDMNFLECFVVKELRRQKLFFIFYSFSLFEAQVKSSFTVSVTKFKLFFPLTDTTEVILFNFFYTC